MTSKHRGSINLCKPFNHLADFSQSSLTGFRCVYFLLCAVCLQSGRILCGWLLFNPLGFQCADPPWGSRLPSPDMSCISTVLYSAWPWYGQAVGYLKLQVVSARHVEMSRAHPHCQCQSERVHWKTFIFIKVRVSGDFSSSCCRAVLSLWVKKQSRLQINLTDKSLKMEQWKFII